MSTAVRENKPRSNARTFWLFVGPFAIGLAIFTYLPILWSAYLSFFDANNTVTPTKFVGFANYVSMLTNPAFTSSLLTFLLFALFIVPITFVAALGLALLVNQIGKFRAFVRSAFFLPTACSYVVAALIWKMSIFNGVNFGLANEILGIFGYQPVSWIATTHPPLYWIVLVSLRLWLQLGFYMILFLAGLQRVPQQLYEAAWIDGAKPGWQTFINVTWPQLRSTAVAVLLLNLINAFQAFDEFYNTLGTTNGYPPYARPPLVYLYYTSLGQGGQDLGRGSAGALILALIIAIVTIAQGRIFRFGSRP